VEEVELAALKTATQDFKAMEAQFRPHG
jgi:hypothetical protein